MLFNELTIQNRKVRAARALDQVLKDDEVVLVHSGQPIQKPGGLDQTYTFLPHPDYFWLTGMRRPHGISAYSKNEGWTDFVLPISREEKIWEGGLESVSGKDVAQLDSWLGQKKFRKTYRLGQEVGSLSVDPTLDTNGLLESYNDVRRVKDAAEIELIRKVAQMAAHGYKKLESFIRPGVTEKHIQIAYESEVLMAGSDKLPYDSIVGTGTNSAVLHAIPTPRVVQDGDIVLIDAGAEVADYCVDITRVYPASGTFSSQQKALFDLVLKAQTKSIELMKPGVEWKDIHFASAREIAQGLKDLNILRCSVEESLETAAISVFFPHGVGHLVGLRVRDVGGFYNPNPKKYAGARLRVDLPLKEGYLMTVEPGCYFIETLLKDQETRSTYKDQINWAEVERWLHLGGIRLEDDILVTAQGTDNLTGFIPK